MNHFSVDLGLFNKWGKRQNITMCNIWTFISLNGRQVIPCLAEWCPKKWVYILVPVVHQIYSSLLSEHFEVFGFLRSQVLLFCGVEMKVANCFDNRFGYFWNFLTKEIQTKPLSEKEFADNSCRTVIWQTLWYNVTLAMTLKMIRIQLLNSKYENRSMYIWGCSFV